MSVPPTVSIGLPVYNGENHLRDAITSILAQTYTDFELVISDNASTDGTEAICREFAAQDARIRYERLPANIGAAPNFNRLLPITRGRYFKWAAHDDICLPEFVGACVRVLETDPAVVLCHTITEVIDPAGERTPKPKGLDADLEMAGRNRPRDRFASLIRFEHWCTEVFGVIRRSALEASPLIGNYATSDRVLLAHLALQGRFHRVPQTLFLSRDHPARSVRATPLQERASWFHPSLQGRIMLPNWRTMAEHVRNVRRVPLPFGQRLGCAAEMGSWMVRYRRLLIKDIRYATKQVIARTLSRPGKA